MSKNFHVVPLVNQVPARYDPYVDTIIKKQNKKKIKNSRYVNS